MDCFVYIYVVQTTTQTRVTSINVSSKGLPPTTSRGARSLQRVWGRVPNSSNLVSSWDSLVSLEFGQVLIFYFQMNLTREDQDSALPKEGILYAPHIAGKREGKGNEN